MLDNSEYDILDLKVPEKGMNQNISPERLDLSYAYILENILPQPFGEGTVRYGTDFLSRFPLTEQKIMKEFPFVAEGGVEQQLLYVQEFTNDGTAADFVLDAENRRKFSFTTNTPALYIQDTPVKVEYTSGGNDTIFDIIAGITIQEQTVTITLAQNSFPDAEEAPVITRVSYAEGKIYSYDVRSQTIGNVLRDKLSVACVPRSTTFAEALYLCNGVDRVMVWDGKMLSDVFQFLKEEATQITRIDDTHLSFKTGAGFNIDHYPMGALIQVSVNQAPSVFTLAARVLNQDILTITVTGVLPDFVDNRTEIFYQAFVPRFNFMMVMYDRLWGLGEGAVGLSWRDPDQAMRVYFAYKPGADIQWFDERTKSVPSLNLSENHGVSDNLEAIAYLNGFMLFMGREKTQAWSGSEPLGGVVAANKPVFQFSSILPVGVVHGDLIVSLPNDVFFIAKTGLLSFSTLNVAKQFSANSFDAVDPLIKEYVKSMSLSNTAYRASTSFKYEGGALAGFKMGFNPVLCSLFSTSLYAWTLFSGDFKEATAFCSLGNSFYLACNNILYKYGDGNDGSVPVFGDEGNTVPVFFAWSLPAIQFKGRRYAGDRYEIRMGYPSSFSLRAENSLELLLSGDLPKTYDISSPCRFDMHGDRLSTIALNQQDPDEARDNDLGFRMNQQFYTFTDKFKFMASSFWVTLRGSTRDGVLSLKGLKFYGVLERQ